jgi:hypothetical protein
MESQPDTTEILEQTAIVVADANEMVVSNSLDYEAGGQFLTRVKTVRKQIDDVYDPAISSAHKHHRFLLGQKNEHDKPLAMAETIVKGKMLTWKRAEEERVRVEEARLREIARKEEEERRLAEAAALEAEGKTDEAEAVIERPATPFVPSVPPPAPKVAGISTRKMWKWRLVDEAKVPRQYFTLDEKKINGVVRSMGRNANIPGIQVYQEETMAVGAGR